MVSLESDIGKCIERIVYWQKKWIVVLLFFILVYLVIFQVQREEQVLIWIDAIVASDELLYYKG